MTLKPHILSSVLCELWLWNLCTGSQYHGTIDVWIAHNISSPLLPPISSAPYWDSSEVWFSHLSPITPFRVQHVSALYILSTWRGGGHGMKPNTNVTVCQETYAHKQVNVKAQWQISLGAETTTHSEQIKKLTRVFMYRSPRFLLNSRRWNCAASCAVMFSRTPSLPHVGWVEFGPFQPFLPPSVILKHSADSLWSFNS